MLIGYVRVSTAEQNAARLSLIHIYMPGFVAGSSMSALRHFYLDALKVFHGYDSGYGIRNTDNL